MISQVIVDTGPLIALIDHSDQHHAWVRSRFEEIAPPLQTCEAVLTEACHLARRLPGGVSAILGLFEQGVCVITFDLTPNLDKVSAAMQQYSTVPMSLADACLVRMSELITAGTVLTLDGDFRIYRRHKRKNIPLLIPPPEA